MGSQDPTGLSESVPDGGAFVNKETGEICDAAGNPMSAEDTEAAKLASSGNGNISSTIDNSLRTANGLKSFAEKLLMRFQDFIGANSSKSKNNSSYFQIGIDLTGYSGGYKNVLGSGIIKIPSGSKLTNGFTGWDLLAVATSAMWSALTGTPKPIGGATIGASATTSALSVMLSVYT